MRDWAVFIIYNSTLVDELLVWLDPFFNKSVFFSRGNFLVNPAADAQTKASARRADLEMASV